MFQQLIALIVILYFVVKLFTQKKRKQVSGNEFVFWLVFWFLAMLAIVFIKKLDQLALSFGLSATGIDILLYIGFITLLYLVFKLRLKLERTERNITKITRHIALDESKENK